MFCKNIHKFERVARVVIGAVVVSFAFKEPMNYWFFLGIVPLVTGLIGNCPAYSLVGFSTCSKESCATNGAKKDCCKH